jgi:hypothetical protein
MSAKTLAQLLLRLWGVALIIWGLSSLGNLFFLFVPAQPESAAPALRASGASAALHVVVYLVAGFFLIRNGDRIGDWLVSDFDAAPAAPASAPEIEAVGFAILGVYFLVTGIRELAGVIGPLLVYPRWEAGTLALWWPGQRQFAIAGMVNVFAGIVLLNRRHRLAPAVAKAWNVLRSRDSSSAVEEENP